MLKNKSKITKINDAELKKLLRKEAELIILHYMGNITSKLDKNRISDNAKMTIFIII